MNIFFTNRDPLRCAREHCNLHANKMIIESAQMLSTAHHVLEAPETLFRELYKPTQINHPCTQWVRASTNNYLWTWVLLSGLLASYELRTGRVHKTQRLLQILARIPDRLPFEEDISRPRLAIPEQFHQPDPYKAYQDYLNAKFEEWRNRERPITPRWYDEKPSWYKGA